MTTNGTRRRYSGAALIANKVRQAPDTQKRLFCLRLYTEWINDLSEYDVNKIVTQLIKQGQEFRPGKE